MDDGNESSQGSIQRDKTTSTSTSTKSKKFGGTLKNQRTYQFYKPASVFDSSSYFDLNLESLKSDASNISRVEVSDERKKNTISLLGSELLTTKNVKLHLSNTRNKVVATIYYINGSKKVFTFTGKNHGVIEI